MPDYRSRQKERERRVWLLTPARRMRLYADEDLPVRIVAMLRRGGANVLTTHEAGNTGRDDRYQAQFAKRKGRVLVTRNIKDLFDERVVPLRECRGIIGLEFNERSESSCLGVTAIVTELIVPFAELYEQMKIRVSTAGANFRFLGRDGSVISAFLSLDQLFVGVDPVEQVGVAGPRRAGGGSPE